MLAYSVLILLNAKTESSHPPISLDDFGGFSLLNKNFWRKPKVFLEKILPFAKKFVTSYQKSIVNLIGYENQETHKGSERGFSTF